MKKDITHYLLFVGLIVIFITCGGGPTEPSYEELINDGWLAFSQSEYQNASDKFSEAKTKDPEEAVAYTGLGWSFLKLDNLIQANSEFSAGSAKNNASADLFAGWAFVLNARKNYTKSNTEANEALSLDPSWSFPYGLSLDVDDLHVLKAENYFLLGDFANSLTEVKILNPNFDVDITTREGQASLAKEIERLKEVS
ncbi:MAG: tetratricopeptide repeat protein [bacterium]